MEKPIFQQSHAFVDNNTKTRLQKQAPPSLNLAHLLPTTYKNKNNNNNKNPIPLLTPLFAPPPPQQEEFCFPVLVNKNINMMMTTAASMEAAGVWHQYQHPSPLGNGNIDHHGSSLFASMEAAGVWHQHQHPSPLGNIDHQGSSLFDLFHSKCALVNRAQ